MKLSIIAAVLTTTLLSGCILSVPGGFSPVQGPLSKRSPIPTYAATMSGILWGSISVVLDNGEVCKGRCWLLYGSCTRQQGLCPGDAHGKQGHSAKRGIQQRERYARKHQGRRRGQQGQRLQSECL
jgi:hypothetical protein